MDTYCRSPRREHDFQLHAYPGALSGHLLTPNKLLSESGQVLHNEDLASAILDRALERARFIHLDRPSGRTRHSNLDKVFPGNSERAQNFRTLTVAAHSICRLHE